MNDLAQTKEKGGGRILSIINMKRRKRLANQTVVLVLFSFSLPFEYDSGVCTPEKVEGIVQAPCEKTPFYPCC